MSFGNSGADDDYQMVTHQPASHSSHGSHGSSSSWADVSDTEAETIHPSLFDVPVDLQQHFVRQWNQRNRHKKNHNHARADLHAYVQRLNEQHRLRDRILQQNVDHEAEFQAQYQRDLDELARQNAHASISSTSSYQMVNSGPASDASNSSYQMVSRPSSASQSHNSNGPRSNPVQELNNDDNTLFNRFRFNFP